MKSTDIRAAFLRYFEKNDHKTVPSGSLVPTNDSTLLFTNAGMVQFKDSFLGQEKPPHPRVASSQRCVRAGGKHNDLDNVGYTARHHTFFEMLGNFSFGDYFKREAIEFAWQFLTKELGISEEKLWVTVYQDDKEAENIWLNTLGVSAMRFSRCGEADNFWSMGDVGPCGPCTEIFYDHGPGIEGGPPGSPEQEGDRYVEIWNLVFMQFNRQKTGELIPLPKTAVDTGMGLERIAAVMQGVHSNYDIDIFHNIIQAIATILKIDDLAHTSLKVIADHIRSTVFLILDGVVPGNEGRHYVLRRIMRRAIRHGHRLGARDVFFYRVVESLVTEMSDAYPELLTSKAHIEAIILQEEKQFAKTLEQGLKILEHDLSAITDNIISGETAFRLYDTYGFPVDLTQDIAREKGLHLDLAAFEAAMAVQKAQSKSASHFSATEALGHLKLDMSVVRETEFLGYEQLEAQAIVMAVEHVEGTTMVALDRTPFYAEGGGQVGDQGVLSGAKGEFIVREVKKSGNVFLHYGELHDAFLSVADKVLARVDHDARLATASNHSATHLLHAALRKILGEHIKQKGSLVEPARLRFDFAHPSAMTETELLSVQRLVNQVIRQNHTVTTELMSPEKAIAQGAAALFGEKYADKVRVLSMGDFSKELCGGTHVERTGDIGFFHIVSETGIAAGVRRLEALTGDAAESYVNARMITLQQASGALKARPEQLPEKIEQLLLRDRQLVKTLRRYKGKLAGAAGDDLLSHVLDVQGVKVLSVLLEDVDSKALRDTLDRLKDKLGSAVIVLACVESQKIQLVAGVTKDLTSRVKAGELINSVASLVGGRGGGRADMAQAGGDDLEALPSALKSAYDWVREKLLSSQA